MNIENMIHKIGSYAKDTRLNFSSIMTLDGSPDLTVQQISMIAIASSVASKQPTLMQDVIALVEPYLTEVEITAAKSAASIMAMNNIYYRFLHLVNDNIFTNMPARLRMNVLANPGIEKTDFELICLSVSAINGCGMCIESHTHELLKVGVTPVAIQSAVRIASVLHAVAVSYEPSSADILQKVASNM